MCEKTNYIADGVNKLLLLWTLCKCVVKSDYLKKQGMQIIKPDPCCREHKFTSFATEFSETTNANGNDGTCICLYNLLSPK